MPSSFSTIRAQAVASWIVSGSPANVLGTNESTMQSVSESRNTSFTNCSAPRCSIFVTPARVAPGKPRNPGPLRRVLGHCRRIDEVALHVEDEIAAPELRPRELGILRRRGCASTNEPPMLPAAA